MLLPLLLAGLALRPVALDEQVLDVRVVDLDADGTEDIVAVTAKHLILLRGGRGPVILREAPPLTVVGHGLCGVVRGGRFRRVEDPFGKWTEGEPGASSLLAGLGSGKPALLSSAGDLDGDGTDDAILCAADGFHTGAGLVPFQPEARLEIYRNEHFAVRYEIPVPVVGNWSGRGRELVFFHGKSVVSFLGTRRTDRLALPLMSAGKEAGSIRRNHVFVRDVDRDGRLDLLVLIAKGSTGIFGPFEATARLWLGGKVFNRKTKKFLFPASVLNVSGALLRPTLLDLDGDGDLDLVLSTVRPSLLAEGSGSYYLFRLDRNGYQRNPAWRLRGSIPMSTFTDNPEPPATFLPDLDRDGLPEAIVRGKTVRLLEASKDGRFVRVAETEFGGAARPRTGKRLAVLAGRTGLLVVGDAP